MVSNIRTREPWSAEEDAYLREAYGMGIPPRHVAKALSRSSPAIQTRARYLGVKVNRKVFARPVQKRGEQSPADRFANPWSKEEDDALIKAKRAGMTMQELTELLAPRTLYAIEQRTRKIMKSDSLKEQNTDKGREKEPEDTGESQKVDRLISAIENGNKITEQNSKTIADLAAAIRRLANLYEHALSETTPGKTNGTRQTKSESIVSRLFS